MEYKHIKNTSSSKGLNEFIKKSLTYADQFDDFLYLNNNSYENGFPHELSFEAAAHSSAKTANLKNVDELIAQKKNLRGFLSYDYKNQIESLQSNKTGFHAVEDFHFFEPKHRIEFGDTKQQIFSDDKELINKIEKKILKKEKKTTSHTINQLVSQEAYIENIKKIKQEIKEGVFYELCYCIPFEITDITIDPINYYLALNELSPTPFSCLLKRGNHYLLCASPERFLKKEKETLISQPIKGTSKRGKTKEEDDLLKETLLRSKKERAENLMIVDLVRNDLAKCAQTGTVNVDELFGIYSFPNVHQMISTVSANVEKDISFSEIIHHTFPMGSMTGAPKIKAMERIDSYEPAKRGLFSGTVGYINELGDFDFNVVIRSINYSKDTKKLSFFVGSAITYESDPEQEYEECLLKAKAIFNLIK